MIVPQKPRPNSQRVRALLRRTHSAMPQAAAPLTSQDGRIALHLAEHCCQIAGQEVHLTAIEFELLRVLMEQEGRPLTSRFLLQHVWGPD